MYGNTIFYLQATLKLNNFETKNSISISNFFPIFFLYTYRSATVNSKSFVGKILFWIKWKFELNSNL